MSAEEPGSLSVFNHLCAPNTALYRRVLGVFVDAKERFQVHLRPDDVLAVMRRQDAVGDVADDGDGPGARRDGRGTNIDRSAAAGGRPAAVSTDIDSVTSALERLVEWGNLSASPDTGRVVHVEDFYRKRSLFQLSRRGEAVEKALQTYDEALGRRGALQAVALDDIAVTLREFLELAAADDLDLGKLQQNLLALTARFTDLAENASAFMSSLQRTIDLTDIDEDVFVAYKTRLIDYLDRFIHDLAIRSPQIAALLADADTVEVDRTLLALATRDSEAAFPDPSDPDATAERDRQHAAWANRWAGLRAWFLSVDGRDSQAKRLRLSALAAIPALLDAVRAVNARRSGRSDRSADYLRLAAWFQDADSDEDRHRLARVVFGLYSARHLTVAPETWERWNDDPALAGAPWSQAPPLEISPQLRRTGRYERKGAPNKVIDRSAERAALALRVRQEAEQIAAARRSLATDGEVELSALSGLDRPAFGLFLGLLGDALVTGRPGSYAVSTASSDGTMSIDLIPIPGSGIVSLETESGTFRGPDHLVRIRDLVAEAEAPAAAGGGAAGGGDTGDVDPAPVDTAGVGVCGPAEDETSHRFAEVS